MTLVPPANWTTANDAAVKQPIYAVQIDGGPEWFYDYDITSGATANHKQRLKDITGVGARYSAIRSEASIGGFSFKILNPSKTEIFTWFDFPDLYQVKVEVRAGYKGLAWSDFTTISTAYLRDIGTGAGHTSMVFRCQDVQDQTNKDVMTNLLYVTGTATTAAGPLDSLTDTNRANLAAEPDDYWNGGQLTITAGTGIGQVKLITDFVSTTGTFTTFFNFSPQPDTTSQYAVISADGRNESVNPITMWLQIMTSITGDTTNGAYDVLPAGMGIGIDDALIDVTEAELIRDDFYPNTLADFFFADDINAKDWFQDNIFRAYALRPVIKGTGLMSIRTFLPPLFGYLSDNNMASLMTDSEIIDLPKWKMDFRDIINRVTFNYDWDYIDQEFDTSTIYNDTTSQTKYGIQTLEIDAEGITTTLSGLALTQTLANKYFQRFAQEPLPITLTTAFNQRIVEPGDQVFITSSHIPNLDNVPADFEWVARGAEVEEVTPDFAGGKMTLKIRDISTGGFKYGVISPGGTPDYSGASATEKLTYCWIDNSYYIL